MERFSHLISSFLPAAGRLNMLAHSADFSRADIRTPHEISNLIDLPRRNTSEEHLGDNVLYLAVLAAVPLQDAAITNAGFPAQRNLNTPSITPNRVCTALFLVPLR